MLNFFKKKNKYVYVNNKLFFDKKAFEAIYLMPQYNPTKKTKLIIQLNNINIPIQFNSRNEAKEEMNRIIKEIES